ncbi:MAG: DMT family transporter [Anaerolineae bacterium]
MSKNSIPSIVVPVIQAICAAALFGASAPLAKVMLGSIEPIPLAALLYLGSGMGALLLSRLRRKVEAGAEPEARIQAYDIPWLLGTIITGGIAAPIVLMFSLRATPAAAASLLLNFEGVATTLIAVLVFREAAGWRVWGAIVIITLGSIALSINPAEAWGIAPGALGIILACALWGVDNNLTRAISAKDPLIIVSIKGIGAGLFSLALSVVVGQSLPGLLPGVGALLLGIVCYGLSIWLFILALRGMGAARTSAFFGTAPFIGATLALILFRGSFTWQFLAALPLMAVGAWLLLGEAHGHNHAHAATAHDHHHRHDDIHHNHSSEAVALGAGHSHWHDHPAIFHVHPHLPDIHHRHTH